MGNLIEIRWHGRGGQGAVTAAKVFAESALGNGKYIQAFPEYGPERTGAPVRSFTRISDTPIVIHSQVTNPEYAVVLDATLLSAVDVSEGVPEDGAIIINTDRPVSELKKQLKVNGQKVYAVDATTISIKNLGRNIPNTPMIGALVKVSVILELDKLIEDFKKKFEKKFSQEVIDGNINAIKEAFDTVKGE